MKQITLKLLFCFALLLPALAGNAADITEDFSTNTNSWLPTSPAAADNYASPTTGIAYTIYNANYNSSGYLLVKKSDNTYSAGYFEVTLPIDCSGVKITTPSGNISPNAALTLTTGETTIGTIGLGTSSATVAKDFKKDFSCDAIPAGTKLKFTTGTKNTQVKTITFVEYVEQEPSTDPELSVFKESYDFGTVLAGKQSAATSVKLKAANLTEDISVSIDNDAFTLSATSIALAYAANGIDVTFVPTEAKEESYSATLTFTSGELTATTTLTGICPVVTGDGTHDNPFTVADVVLLNSGLDQNNNYFVKGTISDKCAANATDGVLGTTETIANSNLVLTDGGNNIGVQLPSGDIRTALNISDHPENVKGTLLVEGTLKNYFNAPGIQNMTSNYELELYVDPSTDPKLSVFKESYDFGAVLAGKQSAATSVKLTAANLTENISVSVDNDAFTLSATSIALADAANGIDVTFAPTEAKEESYSATLTFTSGELTATTTLTGICPVVTGDGTHDNPFTVADVVLLNSGLDQNNKYFVKGTISDKCAANATDGVLGTTENIADSNLVLTDGDNNIGVALPYGDIRTALNISDNPGNVKGTLLVEGTLTQYFKAPGVKNITSNYELVLPWNAGKTYWGVVNGTTEYNNIAYPYYVRYSITTNEDHTLTATTESSGLDAVGGLVAPQFSVDPTEKFINSVSSEENVYKFNTTSTFDAGQNLTLWFYYPYTLGALQTANISYVTCSENEKPELPVQLVITAEVDNLIGTSADIRYTVYPAAYAENCTVSIEGEGTAEQQDGYFAVSGLTKNTEYSYTLKVNDATDANAVEGTATVTFTTPTSDGVDQISADSAAAEYYNLQGIRVTNPVQGQIYIKKQNQKATKVAF